MNPPSGFLRRTAGRTFRDRREAGRALAEELTSYHHKDDLLVLGLARGGVPVGWEVAKALTATLDVFLVRKLGVPGWPELAMGALASGGGVVMNDNVVSSLHIADEQVRAAIDSETAELKRREQAYRDGRAGVDVRGKIVPSGPCERSARNRSSSRHLLGPNRSAVNWRVRPTTSCA